MPSRLFTWVEPMMSPAAAVNPTMTGCDRKSVTKPSRETDSTRCTTPHSTASQAAAAMYRSVPGR